MTTVKQTMLRAMMALMLTLAFVALASVPAQAAEMTPPAATENVCADADADGTEAEAAANCVLRLRQPLADTATPFGADIYLGQTFVAPVGRKVCKVDILMAKNVAVAFGDPVLLQVQTLGGALIDSTFIPSGVIPLGVPGYQTFNFGCDGGNLVAGQTYRLVLFSRPNTPPDAFRWLRNSASVIPGLAQRKVGLGAFANVLPFGSDFAFRLHMCY